MAPHLDRLNTKLRRPNLEWPKVDSVLAIPARCYPRQSTMKGLGIARDAHREREREREGEGGRKSSMKASEAAVGSVSLARCFSTALARTTCFQDERTTSPVNPGQVRKLGSAHSYAPDNRFMVSLLSHDAKALIQPGTIESQDFYGK